MDSPDMIFKNQSIYFRSAENMDCLENESVTLVVTSPPYWDVRDYGNTGGNQIGFAQSYLDYIDSLNRVWKECIRVLQPNGKIAVNLQPLPIASDKSGFNRRIIRNIMHDVEDFMYKSGLFLSGMTYWDKSTYINNVSWGSYPKPTNIATNTAFEQIFTFVKPGKTRDIDPELVKTALLDKNEWRHWAVRMIWDDISPVIKINQRKENFFGHGAPFPEDIPYRLIRMHTIPNEIVLDPFLGSGTTLKMCKITGRKGIGFEINPDFKSVIENRINENWGIPFIDSQYKSFGIGQIKEIIDCAIEEALSTVSSSDPMEISKNQSEMNAKIRKKIYAHLKRSKIISEANIKRMIE